MPHEVGVKALMRLAVEYDIPMAAAEIVLDFAANKENAA
jgi:methylglyoxal synthase